MNVTGMLLVLTACVALLTQTVLCAPLSSFVQDGDPSIHTRILHVSADEQASIHRDRREAVEGGEAVLSRMRRQVAQMAAARRAYSGANRGRARWARARLEGRQRYHRQRAARANVHNW